MLHLLAVAIAVGCMTTLGALPVLASRELSRAAYDTLLGLGAGLMLAAATLGLLPEALVGVRVDGTVHLPLLRARARRLRRRRRRSSSAWTG